MKKNLTTKLTIIMAMVIAMGITSCKKKSDPAPAPIPPPTSTGPTGITSSFYFQATINGTVVTFQDGIDGYGSGAGDQSGTTSTGSWQEIQTGVLAKPPSAINEGGFQIMKDDPSYVMSNTEPGGSFIEGMFGIRSYSYGVDHNTIDPGVDGALVFYVDNNGVEWRTDLGSQSGSTFSIIEHIANTDGYSYGISKAKFTCKLYNPSGASMPLTNGFCRSRTVQY